MADAKNSMNDSVRDALLQFFYNRKNRKKIKRLFMTIVNNMSDNEDLLADDLGDHSLADYNLGNEEEDQLLADDYESGAPQNVPPSMSYGEPEPPPTEYTPPAVQYTNQRIHYHLQPDTAECVVPNITVEVPNAPERPSYAPYEPPQTYEVEQHVPPAMPAAPIESPQMVPTEMSGSMPTGSAGSGAGAGGARSRFPSERPAGAQRTPQHRDIPDTLDKVVVPRGIGGGWSGGGGGGGGRTWRSPHYQPRYNHYRRNNMHRGNFNPRASFPPPRHVRPHSPQMQQIVRPNVPPMRPDIRPDGPPNIRPDLPPNIRPDLPPNIRPDLPPNIRPDLPPNIRPDLPPNIRPDMPPEGLPPNPELPPLQPEFHPEMRPDLPLPPGQDMPPEGLIMEPFRPMEVRPQFRFQFRPGMEEPRPFNPNIRPNFEPFGFQRPFRPFPPMREVTPNMNHIPQVTIRHVPPGPLVGKQEVRMLPVQLPPVPGGLQGKKVLINPHFKGNFQPPVEGPVKDIDDAAERFIAEQRNALARAATRKFPPRRSPQRYIENTTIEIENELARPPRRRSEDDDLLRRQEEFINANRAGLRRRMRSPTPPRRSASPRPRSPDRARPRPDTRPDRPDTRPDRPDRPDTHDEEDGEYRRRMREQEALRDRVMRAKEARRRKRAVAATPTLPTTTTASTQPPPASQPARGRYPDRERDRLDKDKDTKPRPETKPAESKEPEPTTTEPDKPDTTRKSPEKPEKVEKVEKQEERDRSPVRKDDEAEVNSTCEGLTPPLRPVAADSDDDLDLILGDIDGILSDDDDTGRFKEKASKPEPPKPQTDLRSKLPPKPSKPVEKKPPKQRIVFGEEKQKEKPERKRKEKTPPRKTAVSSSTRGEEEKKLTKAKERTPPLKESKVSMRQRITFSKKEAEKAKEDTEKDAPKGQFSNRRVILQRKVTQTDKSVFTRIEVKSDPTKPNPGIFTRAVRTLGSDKNRIVVKKHDEPQIEYESESDIDEDKLLEEEIGNLAVVTNLPHGMTDTRLKTLAGNDVQSLTLDKEDRSAKITFKTTVGAENFKKKFNNKMVAASRLSVTLH